MAHNQTLPDALALLHVVLVRAWPGFVPCQITTRSLDRKKMVLPMPFMVPTPVANASQEEETLIPWPFQETVLEVLKGKAMRADAQCRKRHSMLRVGCFPSFANEDISPFFS